MRARPGLACALAGLGALAGCGDGAAAIRFDAPADGARVAATRTGSGALRARVRVRGRARPASMVHLTAACRPQPCRAAVRAGAGGRWAATLVLRARSSARFVTIDAGARRDVLAPGSTVVTVELTAPARARRPRSAGVARRARRGARAGAAGTRSLPRAVLVIGDSLAKGIEAPLRAQLAGWSVAVDAEIGRPLAEGMRILGAQRSPPAILAFSLFTNDDPRATAALRDAVRATAARPGGCAVWATVVRPPLDGVSYDAANRLLRGLAGDPALALGLRLVDWAEAARASPSLIARDGVHPTPAGYGVLARLYAEAIRACAGAA